MTPRPHIVRTLVRKDCWRLLHNGPALMMLGLLLIVAFVTGSSGLIDEGTPENNPTAPASETQIVYWRNTGWVKRLKLRAPPELGIRFVDARRHDPRPYAPGSCVIEVHPPVLEAGQRVPRQIVHYRYPGTDPKVLWPVARWFLSTSIAYFGRVPQFMETIEPLAPPSRAQQRQAALARVSVADVLRRPLVGTALLTMIQFFAACGLLVSMTAQERERGTMRALLLTPATLLEILLTKAVVHGGLAIVTSALVIAALQPSRLASPLLWATMVTMCCGYLSVGLLIASFAKDQAAPNLLSFGYLLLIGALNLLAHKFEAFQFLSALTFERYGLIYTIASLGSTDGTVGDDLGVVGSRGFLRFVAVAVGLLLVASFVARRRLRAG